MKNPHNILITGASSGIGKALAIFYANKDINLFICGKNAERLNETKEICIKKNANVYPKIIDITKQEIVKQWINECDQIAPLDLVFANAGISIGPGNNLIESEEETRLVFETNLFGVLNTVLPCLAKMKLRNYGQIAITSSLAGYRGLPSAPAYSGSKNAIQAWGEALRGALKKTGIEVNIICPGFVKSRITEKNKFPMPFLLSADKAAKIIAKNLKKNKGRITFPLPLAFFIYLLSCLPARVAELFLTKLPKKDTN